MGQLHPFNASHHSHSSIHPAPFSNENQFNDARLNRNKMVMDRLRRSLRKSFKSKKDHVPESSKPHQWQSDEVAVKNGTCNFPVKYLGCVEVFESRGMQVCEEALRVLRSSKRKSVKGILFVTGDGLRVVDDDTKGLIVDQTIEKVSFCAPDRSHERGFSYICRDGTTRRWMCHGFHAGKDSGERLSHAVGCAFAVCLERKQKRDKESVTMNFDTKNNTFTRTGSFRVSSLTERLQDPQIAKPTEPPPVKQVHNPFAVERPHATPNLLQRQGSLRGGALSASPFKRQLSLRVNDLPSNIERQRAHSVDLTLTSSASAKTNGTAVCPIPEVSPNESQPADSISAMCQELSKGLSMLTNNDDPHDPFLSTTQVTNANANVTSIAVNNNHSNAASTQQINSWSSMKPSSVTSKTSVTINNNNTLMDKWMNESNANTLKSNASLAQHARQNSLTSTILPSVNQKAASTAINSMSTNISCIPKAAPRHNSPNLSQLRSLSLDSSSSIDQSLFTEKKAAAVSTINWNNINNQNHSAQQQQQQTTATTNFNLWTNGNAYQHEHQSKNSSSNNGVSSSSSSSIHHQVSSSIPISSVMHDPFDAEWAELDTRHESANHHQSIIKSTNPFTQTSVNTVKAAFEVQM